MISAFVMVNSVPDQSEWVLDRIGEIEEVEEAYRIWGVYDIIAVVKAETIEELRNNFGHPESETCLVLLDPDGKKVKRRTKKER